MLSLDSLTEDMENLLYDPILSVCQGKGINTDGSAKTTEEITREFVRAISVAISQAVDTYVRTATVLGTCAPVGDPLIDGRLS